MCAPSILSMHQTQELREQRLRAELQRQAQQQRDRIEAQQAGDELFVITTDEQWEAFWETIADNESFPEQTRKIRAEIERLKGLAA